MARDALNPPVRSEGRVGIRMPPVWMSDPSLVGDVDIPSTFASILGEGGEALVVHHMNFGDCLEEVRVGFGFLQEVDIQ